MQGGWNERDEEHLKGLVVGHYIMAGLSALGAVQVLVYGLLGRKLLQQLDEDLNAGLGDLTDATGMGDPSMSAAAMFEGLDSAVMVLMVSLGVLSIATTVGFWWVARMLGRRQWWTFCYLTGWGELFFVPFGTILGIFTLIVLSRPSVKQHFGVGLPD